MSSATPEGVMLEAVVLVRGRVVASGDKTHILRHVLLFGHIFDVETDVDNHLFSCFRLFVADQEGGCHFADHPTTDAKHLLNLDFSEEICRLELVRGLTFVKFLNESCADKWIVDLLLLPCFVERDLNHSSTCVDFFGSADKAENVSSERNHGLATLDLLVRHVYAQVDV